VSRLNTTEACIEVLDDRRLSFSMSIATTIRIQEADFGVAQGIAAFSCLAVSSGSFDLDRVLEGCLIRFDRMMKTGVVRRTTITMLLSPAVKRSASDVTGFNERVFKPRRLFDFRLREPTQHGERCTQCSDLHVCQPTRSASPALSSLCQLLHYQHRYTSVHQDLRCLTPQ